MDTLSSGSYELLKKFDTTGSMPINNTESDDCIEQLLSHELIDSKIIGYDISGNAPETEFSDYRITEKGKGYLEYRRQQEEFQNSIKEIALSAESRSASAEKQANAAESQAIAAKSQVEIAKVQAKSAESQAEFSKIQADTAVKTSKKADVKGWISVTIALLAFLLELSDRIGLF